ncbi:ANTAR domain-containing protein [Microlunatus spumicola]|uniref:ANTAR domain-containing protein n=1 Tax=Microlunatus spumicola TaxID=81499 RepID=UPI001958EE55
MLTGDDGARDRALRDVDEAGLARLMAAVAESLHHQSETEDVLRGIVLAARDTIPGVEHVGVTVAHRNGRMETVAATGPLVYQVDDLQYRLHEGPCVDALVGRTVTTSEDLGREDRWPRYAPAASALGIASQLGMELFDEERTTAGLNLYASRAHAFDTATLQIARLFAVHAAHALGRRLAEQQLTEALSTRKVIGQAVGIVMERYRLSEQQAFTFLTHASHDSGTKLRLIAAQLVDDVDRRGAAAHRDRSGHGHDGGARGAGGPDGTGRIERPSS